MTHRDCLSVPPSRRKTLVRRPIRMIETKESDVHVKQMVACSDRAFLECAAARGDAGVSSRFFDALRRGAEATGPAVFQAFRTALRTSRDAPASPRRALLAESPGKPSLWLIINAPWY
jgi:hypothetical protein